MGWKKGLFRHEKEFTECAYPGADDREYSIVGSHDDQRHQHKQENRGTDGQYRRGDESGAVYPRCRS